MSANSATCISRLINVDIADDVCPYTNIIRYHDDDIIELYASLACARMHGLIQEQRWRGQYMQIWGIAVIAQLNSYRWRVDRYKLYTVMIYIYNLFFHARLKKMRFLNHSFTLYV